MDNHTILIIEVMLAIFACWQFREKIKVVIIDAIKQIQLRNYLAGNERRKLSQLQKNNNLLVDHSNDQLLQDAYKCLSRASITREKEKIAIRIPTKNYPELQDYIENKIDNYRVTWLENNYPGHHWNKATLQPRSLFGWSYSIKEK